MSDLIRLNEVVRKTGLSRSTIYRFLEHDPTFPKRRFIHGNVRLMYFSKVEVEEWIEQSSNHTSADTPLFANSPTN